MSIAAALVFIPIFALGISIICLPHILFWYCARKSLARIYP